MVIKGHRGSSRVIEGHRGQPRAITREKTGRGRPRQSSGMAIVRHHKGPSVAITRAIAPAPHCNQAPSVAISGHQSPSVAITKAIAPAPHCRLSGPKCPRSPYAARAVSSFGSIRASLAGRTCRCSARRPGRIRRRNRSRTRWAHPSRPSCLRRPYRDRGS